MARGKLTAQAAQAKLGNLEGWALRDERLHKVFRFGDFPEAIGFMTRVAFDAERLGHHPNWSNVYNRVEVTLWTHDVGGLTDLDFQLADAIDRRVGD
ncbi:MAG: 4a-hydroxytetrahydrobiopterin dehydratase [Nannocystaceae bacterium]|nr:4a-hydroxytetrahydrobiopterin dehydratase [Nannocystaceae bacterium]